MTELTIRDRILGGLWGAVVGDALGVPVEFRSRSELRRDPVTDMRAHGTHSQPKGTWSDDTSLLLCTVDSLLRHEFDTGDMGSRFVQWGKGNLWTPWGSVFDIGGATRRAFARIEHGAPAEQAGGKDEHSNGNGSLMRILPIALRFHREPADRLLEYASRASAITHGHPRSRIACGFYCLVVAGLLDGQTPEMAIRQAAAIIAPRLAVAPFSAENRHFSMLLEGDLKTRPEDEIRSGGHVTDTLTAGLWCLLRSQTYSDAALNAVNLGEDTDTTGIVAGGLAGIVYGITSIPENWRHALARRPELENLFNQFANLSGRA
ncbi:MAG: ADP-ribosylglycohydrolase family protein [Verrucomicrobiales bacterium]|nr:ADP-ribosylglycohydrolase family protein [Verrucomicrobiales bacterium]